MFWCLQIMLIVIIILSPSILSLENIIKKKDIKDNSIQKTIVLIGDSLIQVPVDEFDFINLFRNKLPKGYNFTIYHVAHGGR